MVINLLWDEWDQHSHHNYGQIHINVGLYLMEKGRGKPDLVWVSVNVVNSLCKLNM